MDSKTRGLIRKMVGKCTVGAWGNEINNKDLFQPLTDLGVSYVNTDFLQAEAVRAI